MIGDRNSMSSPVCEEKKIATLFYSFEVLSNFTDCFLVSKDPVVLFFLSLNQTHWPPKIDGMTGTITRLTKVTVKRLKLLKVLNKCILAFVRGHCSSLH